VLDFHRLASFEVTDAAKYYDERSPHLGERFLDALQRTLERIELTPQEQPPWLFPGVPTGVRQSIVRGFHHSVVFITEPRLYVATVRHHAQHPTRWIGA
jgi:plasmid stabilization system protein ParE